MLGFNGAPSFAQPPQPFASDDAIHQAFGQSHGGYDDGGGGGFDSEFQPTAVLVTDYRSEVPEDEGEVRSPPWRQPRGKSMVSSVNSHTNATSKRWHLWEIDLRFAPGLPPGWVACGRA